MIENRPGDSGRSGGADTTIPAVRARVELLRTPRLVLPSGATSLLERKDAALLPLLAIEGPTPRARAAALLWPDADAEGARNDLRQRLRRLKKAAGGELVTAGETLALEVTHDLDETTNRIAAAEQAADGELLGQLDYSDCGALGSKTRARASVRSVETRLMRSLRCWRARVRLRVRCDLRSVWSTKMRWQRRLTAG